MTKTKFEVMEICNKHDIPVGPILSMKEIAEEPSLRATGTVVEVDHPGRGKYLTVGNPIKLSDSIADVRRSPLLGEHTDEILRKVLGYSEGKSPRSKPRARSRRRRNPRRPRRPRWTDRTWRSLGCRHLSVCSFDFRRKRPRSAKMPEVFAACERGQLRLKGLCRRCGVSVV